MRLKNENKQHPKKKENNEDWKLKAPDSISFILEIKGGERKINSIQKKKKKTAPKKKKPMKIGN